MTRPIRTLLVCLRHTNWNGILSALLVASVSISLIVVMLAGVPDAPWEVATEAASSGEVPGKLAWALVRAVSAHWASPGAPVASVNWNGCPSGG
jgi:hypothetical protein